MPDPNMDAPKSYREQLRRYGGTTPYGDSQWRVVLAQHCIAKRGGIFNNYPSGELAICEPGPKGGMVHRPIKPNSVQRGFFDVPKYPSRGWILEKWFPAHMWGTRTWWESQKAEDGLTPLMGPYPERGDYFLLGGPWPKYPQISDVETAIAHYNLTRRNSPLNFENHLSLLLKGEAEKKIAEREKLVQHYQQIWTTEVLPVLRGTSLAAQGVRNDLQTMMGRANHLGANEIYPS